MCGSGSEGARVNSQLRQLSDSAHSSCATPARARHLRAKPLADAKLPRAHAHRVSGPASRSSRGVGASRSWAGVELRERLRSLSSALQSSAPRCCAIALPVRPTAPGLPKHPRARSRSTSSSAIENGNIVRGLTQADFELREDGQAAAARDLHVPGDLRPPARSAGAPTALLAASKRRWTSRRDATPGRDAGRRCR